MSFSIWPFSYALKFLSCILWTSPFIPVLQDKRVYITLYLFIDGCIRDLSSYEGHFAPLLFI